MSAGEERRVCLLTGAGGLLGTEFCRRWAGEYDILAVCGQRAPAVPSQHERYVDPLDPRASLADNAGAVYVVHADLTAPGEIDRILDIALARFGGVDLLVNNAAHPGRYQQGIVDGDGALVDLQAHLAVNTAVPFGLAVRLAQRSWTAHAELNRSRNRNVVNVSSTASLRVYSRRGQAGYAASKAALNTLTGHLAEEFDEFGVRVNGVIPETFPDLVATEDVADAIVRLDRDRVTGSAVVLEPPTG